MNQVEIDPIFNRKKWFHLPSIQWKEEWDVWIQNTNPQISILQQSLERNPYDYDKHVQLIQLLTKEHGGKEIDETRMIKEILKKFYHEFHKYYPFNEFLWKSYLTLYQDGDKFMLEAFSHQNLLQIYNSLNIAVMEYFMFDIEILRIEVAQRIHEMMQSNPDTTLENIPSMKIIWEDSLERCAGDFWNGALIWKKFITSSDFVSNIIFTEEEKRALLRKAILMPIKDVDQLWDLYWSWEECKEEKDYSRDHLKENHLKIIQLVKRLDAQCAKNIEKYLKQNQESNPRIVKHFERFVTMLQDESKSFECIFAIYRRGCTICCLKDSLWENFISYLWKLDSKHLQIQVVNAVRNCTWNAKLWTMYMTTITKFDLNSNSRRSSLSEIFLQAQTVGLIDANAYFRLFVWYCSFLRNEYNHDDKSDSRLEIARLLRETYMSCADYLNTYFSESEERKEFLFLWASAELRFFQDYDQVRIIMNNLHSSFPNDLEIWKKRYNLEMEIQSKESIVSVLESALNVVDGKRTLDEVSKWIYDFAHEHCSLTEHAEWEIRINDKATILKNLLRMKDKEKKKESSEKEKQNIQQNQKRKRENEIYEKPEKRRKIVSKTDISVPNSDHETKSHEDHLNFSSASSIGIGPKLPHQGTIDPIKPNTTVGPQLPSKEIGPQASSKTIETQNPSQMIGPQVSTVSLGPQQKPSRSDSVENVERSKGRKVSAKSFSNPLTVFMYKIPFSMMQQDVADYFTKKGCNVKSVRLLRTHEQKSRGQAFVDMMDKESVEKALSLDRDIVRKMMIRVAVPRQNTRHQNITTQTTTTKQEVAPREHPSHRLAFSIPETTFVSRPMKKEASASHIDQNSTPSINLNGNQVGESNQLDTIFSETKTKPQLSNDDFRKIFF